MEERTSYVMVGAFVLGAFVVTIGFIIWIVGGRATEPLNVYEIEFDRDVSGLTLGGPVRYWGVDVGQVTAMNLVTDRGTRVVVEIAVAADTPIHEGTYASLAYQGITGVAYINLATTPGEFSPLTADEVGEHPVIPMRDVGLAALLAQSGSLTAQVELLLDDARDLLGDDNQESLARVLNNVAVITDALAGEQETIGALPQNLADGLDEIRAMVDQIRLVLDQSQPDLLAAVAQLNAATASTALLTGRLESWFGSKEADLDAFVAAGLNDLPLLVAEVRDSVRELDKLLVSLRENPSQVIYRPQLNAIRVDP